MTPIYIAIGYMKKIGTNQGGIYIPESGVNFYDSTNGRVIKTAYNEANCLHVPPAKANNRSCLAFLEEPSTLVFEKDGVKATARSADMSKGDRCTDTNHYKLWNRILGDAKASGKYIPRVLMLVLAKNAREDYAKTVISATKEAISGNRLVRNTDFNVMFSECSGCIDMTPLTSEIGIIPVAE